MTGFQKFLLGSPAILIDSIGLPSIIEEGSFRQLQPQRFIQECAVTKAMSLLPNIETHITKVGLGFFLRYKTHKAHGNENVVFA